MNQMHPTSDELVDFLHGELPAARSVAIAAHIAGCSECAAARDAEVSLSELLRAHARAEERELPPGVVAGIRAAVRLERPPMLERWRAAFRPAFVLAAAAAVVLLCYVGFNALRGPRPTTIDAAYYVDTHATLSAVTPFSADDPAPPIFASSNETP